MITCEITGKVQTPWGLADFQTEYAPGIMFYSTPSHGGFHLSPERNAAVLQRFPGFQTFSGAVAWYEEDCDWAVVALTFPQVPNFRSPKVQQQAKVMFREYLAQRCNNQIALAI